MYSQHEPPSQIHTSNLLRAIWETWGDRDYRRKKSGGESDEGTTEQHRARGEGMGWGVGTEGSELNIVVFYGIGTSLPAANRLIAGQLDGEDECWTALDSGDLLSGFSTPQIRDRSTQAKKKQV